MKITTFLLASALMLAAPLSASAPVLAHTSTGNACITTTVDGTPLEKPICDFPALVTGNSFPTCAAVVSAAFSGRCAVGDNTTAFYINGVLQPGV